MTTKQIGERNINALKKRVGKLEREFVALLSLLSSHFQAEGLHDKAKTVRKAVSARGRRK